MYMCHQQCDLMDRCHSNVNWWTRVISSVIWWTCVTSNVSWWTCHQQCDLTAGTEQRAGAGCVLHWAVCVRGLWGFPGKGTLLCRPSVCWDECCGNDQSPQLLVSGGRWVGGLNTWEPLAVPSWLKTLFFKHHLLLSLDHAFAIWNPMKPWSRSTSLLAPCLVFRLVSKEGFHCMWKSEDCPIR